MASDIVSGTVVRHPEYYLEDGNVTFLVENHLFRVHRFFFQRDSPVFKTMLSLPVAEGRVAEGSSDDLPIFLEQVKSSDFAQLLWVYYNERLTDYSAQFESWVSILALAHKWDFRNIIALAMQRIISYPSSKAVDRLAIAYTYGTSLDTDWVLSAMVEICHRNECLNRSEGAKLGGELVALIAQTREWIRADRSGRGTSDATKIMLRILLETW